MIKSIVFDFDGVLVESVDIKTKAFGMLFENQPAEVIEQIIDYHLKNGGISRFAKFRYYYEHLFKLPLSKEKEEELGGKFSQIVTKEVIDSAWVAGAKESLEFLSGKVPLFVVSGTPETELKKIVRERKMEHYFQAVYGAPAEKHMVLKNILNQMQLNPEEVVMVGDALTDYKAARVVNVQFIGRVKDDCNPFSDINVNTIPDLKNLKEMISEVYRL